MNERESRVVVIACAVLELDARHCAERLGLSLVFDFLPGGLHERPDLLRTRLQERIEVYSGDPLVERIVVGYGVCGRGTVGIRAGRVPLAFPRVQDCIALFLGSDSEYRRQFARHPGTFYYSAGWVEGKVKTGSVQGTGWESPETDDELKRRLGSENLGHIRHFRDSWRRNYTRAAFIDTGVRAREEEYAERARAAAAASGWTYERIVGTHDLLEELFTATASSESVLLVRPGLVTAFDGVKGRLTAVAPDAPAHARNVGTADDVGARSAVSDAAPMRFGLGIDAGGTYTDVVVYDFASGTVRAKAKALTTDWDYTVGILRAIDDLGEFEPADIDLVSVSTTLATNAIVKREGQEVGLLAMPPPSVGIAEFRHKPVSAIGGRLSIDGAEIEPPDLPGAVGQARWFVERFGVKAFAVGGYAGHVNPAHELAVKQALIDALGLPVVCGHELSGRLNFRVRAETAALNARLLPCIQRLLERLEERLAEAGVRAPVMVVKSDGSLMSIHAALERPLETLLSGPAASVAGACRLAGWRDALVVDIGGTTTDTARVRGARPPMREDGIIIDGWETHVRALDLGTTGLGGDSRIAIRAGAVEVGPTRLTPIARLASLDARAFEALKRLEADWGAHPDHWLVLALRPDCGEPPPALSRDARALFELLKKQPYGLWEVPAALGVPSCRFVPVSELMGTGMAVLSGFTPTDALHVLGRMEEWDGAAARRLATRFGSILRENAVQFAERSLRAVDDKLALALVDCATHQSLGGRRIGRSETAAALILAGLHGQSGDLHVEARLMCPIIGIGAPAFAYLPYVAGRLGAEALIPEHADVANAVGAITSEVSIQCRLTVEPDDMGEFRVCGVPGTPRFPNIEDACKAAVEAAQRQAVAAALRSGLANPAIRLSEEDRMGTLSDGSQVFIGRVVAAEATGAPDPRLLLGVV